VVTLTGGSGTPGICGTDTEIGGMVTAGKAVSTGAGSAGAGVCTCTGADAGAGGAWTCGLAGATGVAGVSELGVSDGLTLGPADGVSETGDGTRA
jgi:hypothetical protein